MRPPRSGVGSPPCTALRACRVTCPLSGAGEPTCAPDRPSKILLVQVWTLSSSPIPRLGLSWSTWSTWSAVGNLTSRRVLGIFQARALGALGKRKKENRHAKRGMGRGQGPHLHEQDFGRTIRGTGGALLLLTRDTTGSQRGARWTPTSTGGLISV